MASSTLSGAGESSAARLSCWRRGAGAGAGADVAEEDEDEAEEEDEPRQ